MPSDVYEAVAFGMRYWFLFVIGVMLITLIAVSVSDIRQRKNVMGEVGQYIGYLEIIGGADDVLGERIGIMKENSLGNSRMADICISHPSVKKNHALLYLKDGHLILTPLDNSATQINGRRATRPHEVVTGDTVRFGDIEAYVYVKEGSGEEDDD